MPKTLPFVEKHPVPCFLYTHSNSGKLFWVNFKSGQKYNKRLQYSKILLTDAIKTGLFLHMA